MLRQRGEPTTRPGEKTKERNNNKYVGTRNTLFTHVCVTRVLHVCTLEVEDGERGAFERDAGSRRKNVCPADRQHGRRRVLFVSMKTEEKRGKNLFGPYEKRRDAGVIYASRPRENAARNFAFSAATLRDSLTKDFSLARWLLYRRD